MFIIIGIVHDINLSFLPYPLRFLENKHTWEFDGLVPLEDLLFSPLSLVSLLALPLSFGVSLPLPFILPGVELSLPPRTLDLINVYINYLLNPNMRYKYL